MLIIIARFARCGKVPIRKSKDNENQNVSANVIPRRIYENTEKFLDRLRLYGWYKSESEYSKRHQFAF